MIPPLCLSTFLIPLALVSQQGSPTPSAEPRQSPTINSAKQAARILAAARIAQGGNAVGGKIKSLEAELLLEFYDEKGHANVVNVQRKFRTDGSMVTRLEDETTGAVTREGTDGKRFWLADRHGVTLYDKAEFKDEKERIRGQAELMGLLARIVLVKGLEAELRGLRRQPDESGHGLSSQVIDGKAKWPFGGKEQDVVVRLWIQKDTDYVLGVRITPREGKDLPLQICLWDHERNEQGILVPGSIKIYEGPEGSDQHLTAKMYISKITLNPKLPDDLFVPPRK